MKKTLAIKQNPSVVVTTLLILSFLIIFGYLNNRAFAEANISPNGFSLIPSSGFADLVEDVKPAVVNISSRSAQKSKVTRGGINPDLSRMSPFMKRFFQQQGKNPQVAHSLGSGFIVDESGYIVTNNHVIDGADQIEVILDSGEKLSAVLVGSEKETDLALLKVESNTPLPFVNFGNDKQARVGDWIIAIGNPFGLGGTTTTGIISARGRNINSGPYDDFIQIDAPINKGNSGGPLFNLAGEVIGVNSVIYSPNGGNVGIGFAIPASQVISVVAQLKEYGAVERGWLGVHIQELNDDLALGLGLDSAKGALVTKVQEDSPAARAGVLPGDVITAIDNNKIIVISELPLLIGYLLPGASTQMGIIRNSKAITLNVKMNPRKTDDRITDNTQPNSNNFLGLTVDILDSESRKKLNLSGEIQGVLVTSVDENTYDSRIATGDVIKQIGRKTINNPAEMKDSIDLAINQDQSVLLLQIHRNGSDRFVALKIKPQVS